MAYYNNLGIRSLEKCNVDSHILWKVCIFFMRYWKITAFYNSVTYKCRISCHTKFVTQYIDVENIPPWFSN